MQEIDKKQAVKQSNHTFFSTGPTPKSVMLIIDDQIWD